MLEIQGTWRRKVIQIPASTSNIFHILNNFSLFNPNLLSSVQLFENGKWEEGRADIGSISLEMGKVTPSGTWPFSALRGQGTQRHPSQAVHPPMLRRGCPGRKTTWQCPKLTPASCTGWWHLPSLSACLSAGAHGKKHEGECWVIEKKRSKLQSSV